MAPVIAVVGGVTITMYYDDHPPPYFHARYGEYEAKFRIAGGAVLEGMFPRIVARRLTEWAQRNHDEQIPNWQRAEQQETLARIINE